MQRKTVVFLSTHCSLRNWAEKRIYEPLLKDFDVELVYWDRSGLLTQRGLDEAAETGIRIHPFQNVPWNQKNLLRYWGFVFRQLDDIASRTRLAYIVCADVDIMPPALWHRLRRGARYRVYRHEVDYYSGSRFQEQSLLHKLARFTIDAAEGLMHHMCDHIVTLNRHAQKRLESWGVPSRKIGIVGLWKKDEYFRGFDREANKLQLFNDGVLTRDQYELVRGKLVVYFCGFFYKYSYIHELVDAVAERPDDVVLLVSGRGALQPVVEEAARRSKNILFLGFLDEDDMNWYYRITDVSYQPVNGKVDPNRIYFGSTNKMFESLAAGTLFVGSAVNERVDLNALHEFQVFIDFDRDIREQVRALLKRAVEDRAWLAERQQNARLLFKHYNHDNVVAAWLPLFDPK